MYFTLAAIIAAVLLILNRNSWLDFKHGVLWDQLSVLLVRYAGGLFALAIIATLADDAVVIVPAGHRAVVYDVLQKGVRPKPLGEGLNFVMPFVQQVTLMDVRVQKDTYDATAQSKDLQTVHSKVTLNYRPDPGQTPIIYRDFGLGYADKVISPAVQEAIKQATARFTAEELVTRRDDVKRMIRDVVDHQVRFAHIKTEEIYITDFEFSRSFAESIEQKQVAEQQALKAKRDLDRIKVEAEQKIATARAEAESLKMQRDAITSQLIQLRQVEVQKLAIEKWNGQMPQVMMSDKGATPLLDLTSMRPGGH
ncbi:MAG: prohibitin family protein [Elusimicrobia bacterium]|nr:prohibitin family protein [Elusimicrobiota bacterium]